MNTMNMPGFTAEASLYNTGGHYRMAGAPNHLVGSRGVLPQLPIGFCMADCDFIHRDDPFLASVCKLGCFGQQDGGGTGGGGGGGGGGNGSGLVCAKCKAACRKKPLSQRPKCIADCNEFAC